MLKRHLLGAAIALACVVAASPASARHHYKKIHHQTNHYSRTHIATVTPMAACDDRYPQNCGVSQPTRQGRQTRTASYDGGSIIGGRPSGCPHAYCGCGARLYLGISDTRLNLAWNWTKYYHGSTPVAVWHHHIAIIERMTGPGMAILRDYNSGHGLSRIHERSLAGARIVGSTHLAMR